MAWSSTTLEPCVWIALKFSMETPSRNMHVFIYNLPCLVRNAVSMLFAWAAITAITGCGGGGTSLPPTEAATITVQPVSQTVPLGATATFTVAATGTAPLSYQWSENGTPISGATSTTYTTQPVELSDNLVNLVGSFTVTVSNSVSSVTSNSVTLNAGPRSPKAGDLRYLLYQQVDLPGLVLDGGQGSAISSGINFSFPNAVGTPLTIGTSGICTPGVSYSCSWGFITRDLPPPMTGLEMTYRTGDYQNFSSDFQSIAAPDVVISSLDLEPANGEYAIAWVQTAQRGGFDYKLEVVSPSQIAATAAADGAASRIITAVSFDANGQANMISYGWTGDTTTVYETQTNLVPPTDVAGAAAALAGQGYVISAFGGNDTLGYVLVGMRVQGDTLPRPIIVNTSSTTSPPIDPVPPYYTPVVNLFEASGPTVVTEQ